MRGVAQPSTSSARPRAKLAAFALGAGVAALGCAEEAPPVEASSPAPPVLRAESAPPPSPARPSIDGRSFPDKVIALTWDDGPDASTLALARYLARSKISATFFVVSEWIDGVSSEPGEGDGVFETGYRHLPILGELCALGHRLGNHTLNHVLLDEADAAMVDHELRESQRRLDPFIGNGLPLFRAPGGAWNAAASAVVEGDPFLQRLVGPIRWDVDRKDWEGSLRCQSSHPALECEHAAPGNALRVKPSVIAQRYLASIEEAGHGIVLLHDRVGHVGTSYALEVAQTLIPQLEARGYVFAAPVLQFSAPTPRPFDPSDLPESRPAPEAIDARRWLPAGYDAPILVGDVNGDGRADVCGYGPEGVACALSTGRSFTKATIWLRSGTSPAAGWLDAEHVRTLRLADVNSDGRADLCARGPEGTVCAFAP
jgi:peptidoglycan/xylan/chitin deacetylase (PgdA/CDA1 family)